MPCHSQRYYRKVILLDIALDRRDGEPTCLAFEWLVGGDEKEDVRRDWCVEMKVEERSV